LPGRKTRDETGDVSAEGRRAGVYLCACLAHRVFFFLGLKKETRNTRKEEEGRSGPAQDAKHLL
jgi:hypothetical protein